MSSKELNFGRMGILMIGMFSVMIFVNAGANVCSEFDNLVNLQGKLGESINMQCEVNWKLCDEVTWKKKPAGSNLNVTGCDNRFCIRHGDERSVLELPKVTSDHFGSYECWCNRRQPETFILSCFELTAGCQMRIMLPDETLIHNSSVSSVYDDVKAIEVNPEDRHKIECEDGAEHFTTCVPFDDETFGVDESGRECWHLCSLPLNDVIGSCDVQVSLRVYQAFGERLQRYDDESLGDFRGERVKREVANFNATISATVIPGPTSSIKYDASTDTTSTASSTSRSNKSSAQPNSSKQTSEISTSWTSTQSIETTVKTTNVKDASSKDFVGDGTKTDTMKTSMSSSTMKPPIKQHFQFSSILDDCTSLSIFVAVVSFVLSLLALLVAMSCCCYACFTFRHTGSATITSEKAGKEEIALQGVTVEEVKAEDSEDVEEKDNPQENEKSNPPVEPPVTASAIDKTPLVDSPAESLEPLESSEPLAATDPAAFEAKQEKPSTDAVSGDPNVAENHVVAEIATPEGTGGSELQDGSIKETEQETTNVKETAAMEHQTETDTDC